MRHGGSSNPMAKPVDLWNPIAKTRPELLVFSKAETVRGVSCFIHGVQGCPGGNQSLHVHIQAAKHSVLGLKG